VREIVLDLFFRWKFNKGMRVIMLVISLHHDGYLQANMANNQNKNSLYIESQNPSIKSITLKILSTKLYILSNEKLMIF